MPSDFAFMRRFDVVDETSGALYLRRWRIVQTPWFSIYLHKIAMPDKDRELHDHPWTFVSWVLRGGYDERLILRQSRLSSGEACYTTKTVRRGWLSFGRRRAEQGHRIVKLHRTPTWTLVLTGRRRRTWGFFTSRGWEEWRTYLAKKNSKNLA